VNILYLQPLEEVPRTLLDPLQSLLEVRHGFTVLPGRNAVGLEPYYDEQRGQYDSTRILLALKEASLPDGPAKLLAVVPHDLFIPILTFVFGEAELSGSLAVVSYYRLANERYGLPPDPALLIQRLLKESLHEIGHLYGLVHCFEPGCVMRASTTVEEIDVKSANYCHLCTRAIPAIQSTAVSGRF
jgi:archaemetzincin